MVVDKLYGNCCERLQFGSNSISIMQRRAILWQIASIQITGTELHTPWNELVEVLRM